MSYYDDPAADGQRSGRRWSVLAVLVALLVGGGAGYAVRMVTEPEAVAAPAASAPASAPPAPRPQVPPSCSAVAQEGSAVLDQLQRAATAIGALDPATLRAVVDEVRRLRDELQRDVAACRAGDVGGPGTVGSPPR